MSWVPEGRERRERRETRETRGKREKGEKGEAGGGCLPIVWPLDGAGCTGAGHQTRPRSPRFDSIVKRQTGLKQKTKLGLALNQPGLIAN